MIRRLGHAAASPSGRARIGKAYGFEGVVSLPLMFVGFFAMIDARSDGYMFSTGALLEPSTFFVSAVVTATRSIVVFRHVSRSRALTGRRARAGHGVGYLVSSCFLTIWYAFGWVRCLEAGVAFFLLGYILLWLLLANLALCSASTLALSHKRSFARRFPGRQHEAGRALDDIIERNRRRSSSRTSGAPPRALGDAASKAEDPSLRRFALTSLTSGTDPWDSLRGCTACPICLVEWSQDDVVKELVCHHIFHASCIDTWLFQYGLGKCPMRCRTDRTDIDETVVSV